LSQPDGNMALQPVSSLTQQASQTHRVAAAIATGGSVINASKLVRSLLGRGVLSCGPRAPLWPQEKPGMSDLDVVKSWLDKALPQCEVQAVYRVNCNGAIAAAYNGVRRTLGPERLLWHGTPWESISNLYRTASTGHMSAGMALGLDEVPTSPKMLSMHCAFVASHHHVPLSSQAYCQVICARARRVLSSPHWLAPVARVTTPQSTIQNSLVFSASSATTRLSLFTLPSWDDCKISLCQPMLTHGVPILFSTQLQLCPCCCLASGALHEGC